MRLILHLILILLVGCSVQNRSSDTVSLDLSSTSLYTVINSSNNDDKKIDLSQYITSRNGAVSYSLSGSGTITDDGLYSPPTSGAAVVDTVIVSDQKPSSVTVTITVGLEVNATQSNFTGLIDYSYDLSSMFQDGKSPYTYTIDSGATIDSSSGQATTSTVGSYTVTITDSFGDSASLTFDAVTSTLDMDFTTFLLDSGGTHVGLDHTRGDASTIATYFNGSGVLQTVSSNGDLRFDYDPSECLDPSLSPPSCTTSRRPKGPLLEPQSTNSLLYSEEFNNAAWTTNETSVTANSGSVTDPYGTNVADKLVESSNNTTHDVYQDVTITADSINTLSVFVQADERDRGQLILSDTAGTNMVTADFDLGAETISVSYSGSGSNGEARIVNLGNSTWYRLSLSGKIDAASTTLRTRLALADASGNATYTGDGASGFYLFGAQLEEDIEYSTSYIATTATAVTRAADVVSFETGIAGGQNLNFTRDHRSDPNGADTSVDTPVATYVNEYGILSYAQKDQPRITYYAETCSDDSDANTSGNEHCQRKVKGLLLEPVRTNVIDDGHNIQSWTQSGTISNDITSVLGPDELTNATLITKSVITSAYVKSDPEVIADDTQSYVGSVFVKKNSSDPNVYPMLKMCFNNGSQACAGVHLNPYDGTVVADSNNPSASSVGVEDYHSYWRIWVQAENDASGNTEVELNLSPSASTTLGTEVSIYTGSQYFWGAMVEYGNHVTSYIRNAGGVEMERQIGTPEVTTLTGWHSSTEGTLYAKFMLNSIENDTNIFTSVSLNDNTSGEVISIQTADGSDNYQCNVEDASTSQFSQDFAGLSTGSTQIALSYEANKFQTVLDGTLGTEDTSGSLPTVDRLQLGQEAGANSLNGILEQVIYVDSYLDDPALEAITQ